MGMRIFNTVRGMLSVWKEDNENGDPSIVSQIDVNNGIRYSESTVFPDTENGVAEQDIFFCQQTKSQEMASEIAEQLFSKIADLVSRDKPKEALIDVSFSLDQEQLSILVMHSIGIIVTILQEKGMDITEDAILDRVSHGFILHNAKDFLEQHGLTGLDCDLMPDYQNEMVYRSACDFIMDKYF